MWCMSFKLISGNAEKEFRVDQLVGVLYRMLNNNHTFKQKLPIFEDVLNTILTYGDLSMIKQVLALMNFLKIKRNSTIDNIFFNAIRKQKDLINKGNKGKKVSEIPKVLKISDMISQVESNSNKMNMYSKCINSLKPTHPTTIERRSKFMRRTFKPFKELNNFLISDVVTLAVKKKCEN